MCHFQPWLYRLLPTGMLALAAVSLGSDAHAQPPRGGIEVVGVMDDPGVLDVVLGADDVHEFTISTTILSEGRPVSGPLLETVTVLSSEDVPTELRATVPKGSVVADKGHWLSIRKPHPITLDEGIYAEFITVSVQRRDEDGPTTMAGFRYYEVTKKGRRAIDAKEYSSRVERAFEMSGGLRVIAGVSGEPDSGGDKLNPATPNGDISLRRRSMTPDLSEAGEP